MLTCPQLKLCNFFRSKTKDFKIKFKNNLQEAAINKKNVNNIDNVKNDLKVNEKPFKDKENFMCCLVTAPWKL